MTVNCTLCKWIPKLEYVIFMHVAFQEYQSSLISLQVIRVCLLTLHHLFVAERVGVHVVECACVIELPELKVNPESDLVSKL